MNLRLNESVIGVNQIKEWGIFSSLVSRNRYVISIKNGKISYDVYESKGNWIAKKLLGSMRPFEIVVMDNVNRPSLFFRRRFKLMNQQVSVYDSAGHFLGCAKKKTLLSQYIIYDQDKAQRYKIRKRFSFKNHRYSICLGDEEIGSLQKNRQVLEIDGVTNYLV